MAILLRAILPVTLALFRPYGFGIRSIVGTTPRNVSVVGCTLSGSRCFWVREPVSVRSRVDASTALSSSAQSVVRREIVAGKWVSSRATTVGVMSAMRYVTRRLDPRPSVVHAEMRVFYRPSLASSLHHIGGIVQRRPVPQMVGINARRIVAGVKDVPTVGDGPVRELVRHSVRQRLLGWKAERSISIRHTEGLPLPTTVRADHANLTPEPTRIRAPITTPRLARDRGRTPLACPESHPIPLVVYAMKYSGKVYH